MRGKQYSCCSYLLTLVQPCKVDQNENRCIVHFIIPTLKTLVKIIAHKDKGKVIGIKCAEDMIALGQFYQRTFHCQFSKLMNSWTICISINSDPVF